MKKLQVFGCDHCGYYKKTKKSVETHEYKCFMNPKNKACASCKHNTIHYVTRYNPDHGGNPGSTDYEERLNYCEKLDFDLNPKTLRKDCHHWAN